MDLYVKVLTVTDTTAENAKSSIVNLGILPNPDNHQYVMNSVSVDITNKPDLYAFFTTNVGKVVEVPFDLKTVTVL